MSRILRHVGVKEYKKVHQRKLDEQNLLWQEEDRKYSNIQEIKRISERFKSDWRTELAEAMSSKNFPYIYGGVVAVDILSLTNLPGSQFAQNSIQSGAKQTDYSFGSEFPGSYVNSIGDIPNVVASAVDGWDSINDLGPSGWTPLNSHVNNSEDPDVEDITDVVSFGQETSEFKDTHFGTVFSRGDRVTIHTGDNNDIYSDPSISEPGNSTISIQDLRTLFPGVTFPKGLPGPYGFDDMDPAEASMILRTFKDVRVGDKLSFNYSFDTLETEENDDVTYRGDPRFATIQDLSYDDYVFVIVGDSFKGKLVSVLARDGNNLDFNFTERPDIDSDVEPPYGTYVPDVLQGRFPLTGNYKYTVTKDDIDNYGNVKFFIGIMDVYDYTAQSTVDITSLRNETRAAAGKLGKVTPGGYDLGAPVSALDPGHRERMGIERKDIQMDRINVEINNIQTQINNLRAKEQALLDAYTNRESYMDKYLKIQEKWAKIIDPLQYEFQTKYIGQMAPKGLADKINSLISQQDAELEAMRKEYDLETLKFESNIRDLQNQQAQKQNELQTKKQTEFNYNEYLKSLPPNVRADAERGGQTKDFVSNLVDIGIGLAVAKTLVAAIGPASASAVTKGVKILDKAREWWNKGRNVRVKDENNASWKELWADDLAQRGQSDASFAAGKPPRGIGRPDQAFNPFRPASKGGPGSGPTPAVRQAFERPFRSLMNLFQSYEYAGSLLSEQSNSDEAFYDAMDKALKQIKTIGQFKELIKFLEVSAQQKGGEKKGGALYQGQPSPNGFPDNPPAQLAPNGYHPEFGKRANRYRTLDPVSARTMARVMTGDPETDSQVAAAARQPKVAPQKSTTWRRAKKHLKRA